MMENDGFLTRFRKSGGLSVVAAIILMTTAAWLPVRTSGHWRRSQAPGVNYTVFRSLCRRHLRQGYALFFLTIYDGKGVHDPSPAVLHALRSSGLAVEGGSQRAVGRRLSYRDIHSDIMGRCFFVGPIHWESRFLANVEAIDFPNAVSAVGYHFLLIRMNGNWRVLQERMTSFS